MICAVDAINLYNDLRIARDTLAHIGELSSETVSQMAYCGILPQN